VDLKSLHAKIGQLTLEKYFLEGALTKAGAPSTRSLRDGVESDDRPRARSSHQAASRSTGNYSILGITVNRKLTLKWLFPQEKATFQCAQKDYINS
jgi:hypothetical protein